jgi:uncharacterized protein YigE (DUF2233 family)
MNPSPTIILLLALLSACLGCSRGGAPSPEPGRHDAGSSLPIFSTFGFNARRDHIEIFLRDDSGRAFNTFDRLAAWLAGRNRRLRFAMNAGMYQTDFSPVGLLVRDGRRLSRLNVADGTGNFYLKPNGVLLVGESGARIVETSEYPGVARGVRLATQSGPLLVRNGRFHPGINPASTSRLVRNGVGVAGDSLFFVISEVPVTFYELASYFRETLHCPDALYLDGVVSGLYSPALDRNDHRADLGPIIAVVE